MASDKEKVATHEAGHALAILMSPFREEIVHVGVYCRNGNWFGYTVVFVDRGKLDPTGVFEFTKGLAGPLTQLHFYPKSVPADLSKIIEGSGSLLNAARHVIKHELAISTNWWDDLIDWNQYCLRCLRDGARIRGDGFLAVEKELNRFLKNTAVESVVKELVERLVKENCVERDELLAIPVDKLPKFHFPENFPE